MLNPLRSLTWIGADLRWLVSIHLLTLVCTGIFVGFRQDDVRVHLALILFVLPGFWLAPRIGSLFCWSPLDGFSRYLVALVLGFVIHGWLAWILGFLGLGFSAYYVVFFLIGVISLFLHVRGPWLRDESPLRLRLPLPLAEIPPILAALVLLVVIFRFPLSNDIGKFLLQQIDVALRRQLVASPIGMTAFGLDQVVPRWEANLYHLWLSLLQDLTQVPIERLVRHIAPIPLAVMALVALLVCVVQFSGRHVPIWIRLGVIFAPITLWFRDFTPYVYAFRFTNNLCLDKDFALFFLIPGWLLFAKGALESGTRGAWVLLHLLIPICLRFHPLTSLYLVLLFPFVVGTALPKTNLRRSCYYGVLLLCLVLTTLWLGDAQTSHKQIEELVRLDVERMARHSAGPHYWSGHYAMQEGLWERSSTIGIGFGSRGPMLRWSLFTHCSLLLVFSLILGIYGVPTLVYHLFCRKMATCKRWFGVTLSWFVLLILFVGSGAFLRWAPHLYRGIERLHWFAYLPALCASALFVMDLQDFGRRFVVGKSRYLVLGLSVVPPLLVSLHLLEQAQSLLGKKPSVVASFPFVHSLFDYHAGGGYAYRDAPAFYQINGESLPRRPSYMTDSDRVLLLSATSWIPYWEIRQGVYWPELYGEAFAYALSGSLFLRDYHNYHRCVDGRWDKAVIAWILEKRVTLIVDSRPSAVASLKTLSRLSQIHVTPLAPHTFRLHVPGPQGSLGDHR